MERLVLPLQSGVTLHYLPLISVWLKEKLSVFCFFWKQVKQAHLLLQ